MSRTSAPRNGLPSYQMTAAVRLQGNSRGGGNESDKPEVGVGGENSSLNSVQSNREHNIVDKSSRQRHQHGNDYPHQLQQQQQQLQSNQISTLKEAVLQRKLAVTTAATAVAAEIDSRVPSFSELNLPSTSTGQASVDHISRDSPSLPSSADERKKHLTNGLRGGRRGHLSKQENSSSDTSLSSSSSSDTAEQRQKKRQQQLQEEDVIQYKEAIAAAATTTTEREPIANEDTFETESTHSHYGKAISNQHCIQTPAFLASLSQPHDDGFDSEAGNDAEEEDGLEQLEREREILQRLILEKQLRLGITQTTAAAHKKSLPIPSSDVGASSQPPSNDQDSAEKESLPLPKKKPRKKERSQQSAVSLSSSSKTDRFIDQPDSASTKTQPVKNIVRPAKQRSIGGTSNKIIEAQTEDVNSQKDPTSRNIPQRDISAGIATSSLRLAAAAQPTPLICHPQQATTGGSSSEEKQEKRFIICVLDMVQSCSPPDCGGGNGEGSHNSDSPMNLKKAWKWLKYIMEDYVALKKKKTLTQQTERANSPMYKSCFVDSSQSSSAASRESADSTILSDVVSILQVGSKEYAVSRLKEVLRENANLRRQIAETTMKQNIEFSINNNLQSQQQNYHRVDPNQQQQQLKQQVPASEMTFSTLECLMIQPSSAEQAKANRDKFTALSSQGSGGGGSGGGGGGQYPQFGQYIPSSQLQQPQVHVQYPKQQPSSSSSLSSPFQVNLTSAKSSQENSKKSSVHSIPAFPTAVLGYAVQDFKHRSEQSTGRSATGSATQKNGDVGYSNEITGNLTTRMSPRSARISVNGILTHHEPYQQQPISPFSDIKQQQQQQKTQSQQHQQRYSNNPYVKFGQN